MRLVRRARTDPGTDRSTANLTPSNAVTTVSTTKNPTVAIKERPYPVSSPRTTTSCGNATAAAARSAMPIGRQLSPVEHARRDGTVFAAADGRHLSPNH